MITSEDPTSLRGLRVVIAGGTTGIGRATAARLVREGAKVLVFGRNQGPLDNALVTIGGEIQNGGEIHGVTGDQAQYADVARVFAEADARLGGVDVLVASAGLASGGVADTDPTEFDNTVRTNVVGYMNGAHEAMKRMRPQGKGHIVFIGSMSAVSRGGGGDVYVATKAANQAFAESLRKTASEYGVKVSLVEPGLVGTDMQTDISLDKQREMIESGDMLKSEDIAAAVLYILHQPDRSVVTDLRIRPLKQPI